MSPVLYLYRRIAKDSGGAGKFRGGVSGEWMMTVYEVDRTKYSLGYIGKKIPALGVYGGQPGASSKVVLKKNTDVMDRLKEGKSSIVD